LKRLQDIPGVRVSLKVANCIIEIVWVENQAIEVVELISVEPDENVDDHD